MIACCSRHVQLLRPHISVLGPFYRPRPPRRCRPSSPVPRPVAEAAARWGGREGGREGGRDSILASFHPLVHFGARRAKQGRAREAQCGCKRSLPTSHVVRGRPLSLSSVLLFPEGSVPIRALISRGGEEGRKATYQASKHSLHAPSLSRLFLHPQCSTYAHKYSSKNCSLLHAFRCCG